jgi:hypothetical protein
MAFHNTLNLIKNPNFADCSAPSLVQVLIQLIQELSFLCDTSLVSLNLIPAFQNSTNEWQHSLLQIYENLLMADCLKQKRSLRKSVIQPTFSKALESFIEFLHQRRVKFSKEQESPETNFFQTRLAEINS